MNAMAIKLETPECLRRILHREEAISFLFFAAVMEASDVLCIDSMAIDMKSMVAIPALDLMGCMNSIAARVYERKRKEKRRKSKAVYGTKVAIDG
jgi:hypothetical protein